MLKKRKDGSVYYYYYKKKVGRHKKRGRKPTHAYSFYYKYTKKYANKYDFALYDSENYQYCKEQGWLDKLYPYVCRYTKRECKELCKVYSNSDELKEKNVGLYECIEKHNWLNDFFNNKKNNGYTYMKAKKIYKIEPSTMKIVGEYSKVKDITSDVHIYRVLSGEKNVYDDGYIYRKDFDIEIDQNTGKVVDKLCAKTKDEKMYIKYDYVINLLKNTSLSLSEICRESNLHGYKISEPTCRMLKEKYCENLD